MILKAAKNRLELKIVKKSDYSFLYELLSERDSKVSISHEKMPSFQKHVKFVSSQPYSKWYIVYNNLQKVGSVYLSKQDEIGIHLKMKLPMNEMETKILKLLIKKNPRKKYFINVNPNNKKTVALVKKNGFKLIQHTYELEIRGKRK